MASCLEELNEIKYFLQQATHYPLKQTVAGWDKQLSGS